MKQPIQLRHTLGEHTHDAGYYTHTWDYGNYLIGLTPGGDYFWWPEGHAHDPTRAETLMEATFDIEDDEEKQIPKLIEAARNGKNLYIGEKKLVFIANEGRYGFCDNVSEYGSYLCRFFQDSIELAVKHGEIITVK